MSKSIDKVVKEDITKTLNDFDKLSLEIKNVINEDVKVLLKDLKQTAKSSKDVDKVLDSLENTLQKIDDTVDNFNNNGGNMIFNTREVPYGPGEKK
jgi:ABC-type transporter Mla subunit MlaD